MMAANLNNKVKMIGTFNLVPKKAVKASHLWKVAEEEAANRGIILNEAVVLATIKQIIDEEKGVFDLATRR